MIISLNHQHQWNKTAGSKASLPTNSTTSIEKIKENKPNQAARCDAFEAALASPTESFPAAALSEMSNANKEK